MSSSLISQGLQCFAAGDLDGAARLWLAARASQPGHPELEAYLAHLRALAPELVAQLEVEAAAAEASALAAEVAVGDEKPAPTPPPGQGPPPPGRGTDPWDDGQGVPSTRVSSRGPGLDLLSGGTEAPAEPPRQSAAALVERLRELLSLDSFSAALEIAQTILRQAPNHAEALRAVGHCRQKLENMYASKLGDLKRVPSVHVPPGELIWLDLDHRAGFVLGQVDGLSSFDEIIDITGMERLEAMRILCDLLQKKVIGV